MYWLFVTTTWSLPVGHAVTGLNQALENHFTLLIMPIAFLFQFFCDLSSPFPCPVYWLLSVKLEQYNTIQYKTYNAPYVTKMLFVVAGTS